MRIRSAGNGEPGTNGGPPGDLYIEIRLKKHEIFERDGDDLHCPVPISFITAALGGEIDVPTLAGKAAIDIPEGTQTGKQFRLRGKGIKGVRSSYPGDLYCHITRGNAGQAHRAPAQAAARSLTSRSKRAASSIRPPKAAGPKSSRASSADRGRTRDLAPRQRHRSLTGTVAFCMGMRQDAVMGVTLTFLGGTGTVTGSKYLVQHEGHSLLVDCGLFQGYKQLRLRNWRPLPVAPEQIDAVVLTHAHLDHSGYLPLLAREGFAGRVYATPATRDLCGILLPDSGHIQEEDAALRQPPRLLQTRARPAAVHTAGRAGLPAS